MTHYDLVERAASWLRNRMHCRVVLTEQTTGSGEIPDAIGWKYGNTSYLVECKVSRADFFADRGKPFRCDPALGMGTYRYYMAPAGVLKVEDLDAVCHGWGLLEVSGRSVWMRRDAEAQTRHCELEEIAQLVQTLAMVQARIPDPLHRWVCAPDSPYGQMRQHMREVQRKQRERDRTRTCSYAEVNPKEQWEEEGRLRYCPNLVAQHHTRCSEHGGKSQRIKLQA